MRGSGRCREMAGRPAPARRERTTSSRIKAMKRGPAWRLGRGAGSRWELSAELSNRVSAQKTIIARHRQGPKTGSRYARLRAGLAANGQARGLHISLTNVPLQHRQASRPRAPRKGFVQGRDFLIAEHEIPRRGIFGGVLGGRGFWNRKHARLASEKTEGDLARRCTMCVRDCLQHPAGLAARRWKII